MFNELKNMRFKETLWVNFLRGAAAGAVWMVIILIVRPPDMPIGLAFSYPIAIAPGISNHHTYLLGIFQLVDLNGYSVHGAWPFNPRLICHTG